MDWQDYGPDWLVELARSQYPTDASLAKALANCTRARYESRAYVHFVDASDANKTGSAWQFRENIRLDTPKGEVILDVLQNGAIGGAEFLWLV